MHGIQEWTCVWNYNMEKTKPMGFGRWCFSMVGANMENLNKLFWKMILLLELFVQGFHGE